MATNKDTIDKLNRLQFFYWAKPTKTPEVLKQDIENAERDFALIRKDLEILEILKKHIYFSSKSGCIRMKDIYKSIKNFDFEELKEWLER